MSADFQDAARIKLADRQLRTNVRRAMDGLASKRRAQFPDAREWGRIRGIGEAIRRAALARLPELLEQLEGNCRRNGIQVHWAETVEQANGIILEILRRHGATSVVKGKSMVSEEMHLNAFLDSNGINSIETDLGEYIIQLDGEMPSHIIMPALHMNRQQIAHLFRQKIKEAAGSDDAATLTAVARKVLRKKFAEAQAGISGVNFAVAETGTLCLVENEGNGRMCTTVPPVHIAIAGIEKVVARLEDVPPLVSLLTRSATGQPITTYLNMITSPRKDGEKDGPSEVHLVLLDNGRSRIYADEQLKQTLQCIRCGACMNHCPVYTRVGGHAYQAVYPGPIGKILMPQMKGIERHGDLPHASSLCNACVEVCPVKIPIADILVRLRREAVNPGSGAAVPGAGARSTRREALAWRGWAWVFRSPGLYRTVSWLATRFGGLVPSWVPPLDAWTSVRTKPRFAPKTLHDLVREKGRTDG